MLVEFPLLRAASFMHAVNHLVSRLVGRLQLLMALQRRSLDARPGLLRAVAGWLLLYGVEPRLHA